MTAVKLGREMLEMLETSPTPTLETCWILDLSADKEETEDGEMEKEGVGKEGQGDPGEGDPSEEEEEHPGVMGHIVHEVSSDDGDNDDNDDNGDIMYLGTREKRLSQGGVKMTMTAGEVLQQRKDPLPYAWKCYLDKQSN